MDKKANSAITDISLKLCFKLYEFIKQDTTEMGENPSIFAYANQPRTLISNINDEVVNEDAI